MKNPHTELKNQALVALSKTELGRFWGNETGAFELKDGSYIHYGAVGSPDIEGILLGGFYFGGEVKTGTGKLTKAQKIWKEMIEKYGGLYIEIRSIETLEQDLKNFLYESK